MTVENGISVEGVVAADVPCVGCGYNLRTMQEGGVCPECGRAVGDTLKSWLMRAGRAHVMRIVRATSSMAWLNVLIALLIVGGLAAMIMISYFVRGPGEQIAFVAIFGGCTLAAVRHAAAAWRITTPPPGERMPRSSTSTRRAAIGVVLMTLVPTTTFGLQAISRAIGNREMMNWMADANVFLLAAWALLLPCLAYFAVLMGDNFAQLCKAVEMQTLATWHRWVSRVMALGIVLISFTYVVFVLANLELIVLGGEIPRVVLTIVVLSGVGLGGLGFLAATVLLFVTGAQLKRLVPSDHG